MALNYISQHDSGRSYLELLFQVGFVQGVKVAQGRVCVPTRVRRAAAVTEGGAAAERLEAGPWRPPPPPILPLRRHRRLNVSPQVNLTSLSRGWPQRGPDTSTPTPLAPKNTHTRSHTLTCLPSPLPTSTDTPHSENCLQSLIPTHSHATHG